jgi:drug/metabolite transporter (DMT)-like permease
VGLLLFKEIPTVSTLLGAAIIIPSTLYVVWAENRKSKEAEKSE